MKRTIVGAATIAATFAFATGAFAVVGPPYCEDQATPSITAPDEGASKCQKSIVKNTQKYVKSVLKVRGKCLSQQDYTACPNAEDDTKVQEAANKAVASIAKACESTTGLGTSYDGASGTNAGSCTLSQNHGTTEIYLAETHGNGTNPTPVVVNADDDREDCQAALNKSAQKFLPSILKPIDKCIAAQIKAGNVGALGATCVGSIAGGAYVPPTDADTVAAINKAATKATAGLDKGCTGLTAAQISTLFSCPLATTEADLDACVLCSGYNAMLEIVGSQYSETGTIVSPAAGAIQAAVDAGSPGDKFLIASGDYEEGVTLPAGACSVSLGACPANNVCSSVSTHPGDACTTNADCNGTCDVASTNAGDECTVDGDCDGGACQVGSCEDACPGIGDDCVSNADGMQFVGCGAASDNRPVIKPPAVMPPTRGFLSVGVDNLHFQALSLVGWENDGVFVSGADGASFRDIFGDGEDLSTPAEDSVSVYAVFPVKSSNVLVEGCEVVSVRDAGIYVGQSDGVVMRHNEVYNNVSGMELENSLNGIMYGNTTYNNTGGILVFKLDGPEHQQGGFHYVFDNTSYDNDGPNFAIPGSTVSAVPRGTGMMVISDDDSVYENNVVEYNDSYGFLILDQVAVNALVDPDPFSPPSYDQSSQNLTFINNRLLNENLGGDRANGLNPGPEILFGGNWTWAISTTAQGTCWNTAPATVRSHVDLGAGETNFPLCP
jgi:parallel beta-helix repeat protein